MKPDCEIAWSRRSPLLNLDAVFGRAIVAALALGVGTARADATAEELLAPLRWTQRVLLAFTPSTDDTRVLALRRDLAARACAVRERDLVVVSAPSSGSGRLGTRVLSTRDVSSLRSRFGVGRSDFTVVLVGKDGTEKVRTSSVPDLDRLFARIDAMPMRRAEMAARASGCTS